MATSASRVSCLPFQKSAWTALRPFRRGKCHRHLRATTPTWTAIACFHGQAQAETTNSPSLTPSAGKMNPRASAPKKTQTHHPNWRRVKIVANHCVAEDNIERARTTFGELSPRARALHSDITHGKLDPAEYIQQSTLDGKELLEVIRTCIDAEVDRVQRWPRHERKAHLSRGLARTVLDRIWSSPDFWRPMALHDVFVLGKLGYLAVLEGLTDLLFEWIQIEASGDQQGEREESVWRGHILRATIQAQCWATVEYSADQSIELFFKAYDVKSKHRSLFERTRDPKSRAIARISLEPSAVSLAKELMSGRYTRTTPELYDRFLRFYAARNSSSAFPMMSRYILAAFQLTHPTKPSADLAFDFFSECCKIETRDSVETALADLPFHQLHFQRALKRTIELLNQAERREDADFIARISPIVLQCRQGPRLHGATSHLVDANTYKR